MGRVFITGDTHGTLDIAKITMLEDNGLTRDDYLIILGDAGIVWASSRKTCDLLSLPIPPEHLPYLEQRRAEDAALADWYESRPWTTLFIDGNHDNHIELGRLPRMQWNGGEVGVLREHVLHLRRAQVFDICGMSFFTMGGAESIDRASREKHLDWWSQEIPSREECAAADRKIAETGRVDYVLTHCPPRNAAQVMLTAFDRDLHFDDCMRWLEEHVDGPLSYGKWLYGHMHADFDDRDHMGLYDRIVEVTPDGVFPAPLKSEPTPLARAKSVFSGEPPESALALGYTVPQLADLYGLETQEVKYAIGGALFGSTLGTNEDIPGDCNWVIYHSDISKLDRYIVDMVTRRELGLGTR